MIYCEHCTDHEKCRAIGCCYTSPEATARRIMSQGGQILLPFNPDEDDHEIVFIRTQLFRLIVEAIKETKNE